jgi:anaerobic magnesium-protoporphyrin IX monomethyl ester cyclase
MGALKKRKHNIGVWFQDVHHQEDEFLKTLLDQDYFQVVGIGFVAGYYPYRKIKRLSHIINSHKRRKKINFVLGGHGPAGAPEFFLNKMKADTVVVGEGEDTICQIAEEGKKGIIKSNSVNGDYPDLDCYGSFPLDVYRLNRCPTSCRTDFTLPILSSRGCKWSCSFCYRMRTGYHERSVEAIIEEIKFLHKNYAINHFDFEDELLMASKKRTEEMCQSISRLPFKIKWDCNGRLNFATLSLLHLMKSSGCEYVNYGIESLNQNILNQMGKGLTLDQIHKGVEATLEAGLSPGLNLLWGFPGDTEENLKEEVKFLLKYDPCDELRTIRPVTPYPGCRLFDEAIKRGLVKDAEEFYEVKHKNSDLISINFMDIPTDEAHKMLYKANQELVKNYVEKKTKKTLDSASRLYLEGDTSFRGFRPV